MTSSGNFNPTLFASLVFGGIIIYNFVDINPGKWFGKNLGGALDGFAKAVNLKKGANQLKKGAVTVYSKAMKPVGKTVFNKVLKPLPKKLEKSAGKLIKNNPVSKGGKKVWNGLKKTFRIF